MPPSEENSDSHTGGNHHQRGIACSGKLVGSPCCPPVSGSAPFSESMLGEDSRRQLHRPAYEVGAGFPLRINRSNHHFREHRRHSDQGLIRHGSSPIWTRSDLLAKDSSTNPRHTGQCPRWWSRRRWSQTSSRLAQRRIGYATSRCRYQPLRYSHVRRRRFAHLRKLVLRVADNTLK